MTDFLVSTFGTTLRDHEGNTIPTNSVEAEMIGVYFSAHWCPPCRSFTPVLSRTYLEIQKHNKSFEIIFVSSDHTPGEFEGYHASMPWLALPYDSPLRKVLGMRYHITGIPSLVLMKKDGTIVSQNGRQEISKPNFIFALPDKIEQNKAIDECVDSLLSDESLQMQIKSNGCKTLVKVLSNIIQNPGEAKYRRLDKGSDTFREKLKNRKFVDILLASGFQDKGEILILPSTASMEVLQDAKAVLSAVHETFADV